MKVKLTLNTDVIETTSLKFAKSKELVPDTARYLYVFFGKKTSLSDLLVNLTESLPTLKIIKEEDDLNVLIPGTNTQFIEFVVNLKLFSMKIGRLLFEFERELLESHAAVISFIKRHDFGGFNFNEFKGLLIQEKYDESINLLCVQYENLKRTFYVLHNNRYSLLESKGLI